MHTWNYKMTLLRQKKKLVVFTVILPTVNFQHKNLRWWSIMRAKTSIRVVWVEINIPTYRNDPKFSDTQNICCNHSKVWTMWHYHRLMSPNDADGMANSVDPDQTFPLGAVWSGSALFAQAYLSENLGSLRYQPIFFQTCYYKHTYYFIWPNVGQKHECLFKTSGCLFCNISYEPGYEKTCLTSYANNKGADQPVHPRSLISAFVVRCLDSKISLDSIAESSRT